MVEHALLNKLVRLNKLEPITLSIEELGDFKDIESKVDFNKDGSVTIQFRDLEVVQ